MRRDRSRRSARPMPLCFLFASCASGPAGPPLPLTAHSLFDDSILVQGFVRGTVQRDISDRTQLLELVRLERVALSALETAATDHSDQARRRAQDALAALATYAAAVGAAPPALPPGLSRLGAP